MDTVDRRRERVPPSLLFRSCRAHCPVHFAFEFDCLRKTPGCKITLVRANGDLCDTQSMKIIYISKGNYRFKLVLVENYYSPTLSFFKFIVSLISEKKILTSCFFNNRLITVTRIILESVEKLTKVEES